MQKISSKLKRHVLFGFLFVLVIIAFLSGKEISKVSAQVPPPPIPCSGTGSPEYHSLRPYQSSPCNDQVSETALFCGNQLVLQDTVSASEGNCSILENGDLDCTVTKTKEVAIDLSGADLPILGNTEDVVNSQNSSGGLDSAEKTTEYASWYLSGVPNKAELPAYDPEDPSDLVNFSGPLNKLLPKEVQKLERITTVDGARDTQHDQVIGCVDVLGQIVPCYPSSLLKREVRLSHWQNNLPPLESEIGTEYDDFKDYWIAYRRWQGQACARIPVIDVAVCINNPFKPDYLGNLWANIPLASTEDKKGQVETQTIGVQPASEGVEISNVSFTEQQPAELFFAHTEEVAELAGLLQKTYIPEGQSATGGISGISPSDFGSCDLTNIRTNPGDDLFAGEIRGNLSYTARFTCEPEPPDCFQDCLARGNTPGECSGLPVCSDDNVSAGDCSKTVNVGLSLQTETPKADEIWQRTVAGSAAVFKRIFPKIGLGGPILGLLDMPAATKVTYSSADGTTVLAGNPQNQRSGEGAELYFPHLGSVEEYFLKGIQTILRPKGFGEPIASGELGATTGSSNCNADAPSISLSRLISREDYYNLALRWVGGLEGTQALECYNDAVGRAEASGVNTALLLWIWMNESGASNYNHSSNVLDFGIISAPSENFNEQIVAFIRTAQSYSNASSNPQCAGRSVSNLQAFAYLFATGTCNPNAPIAGVNQTAQEYYEAISSGWSLMTSCPLPSSTTDTSCP